MRATWAREHRDPCQSRDLGGRLLQRSGREAMVVWARRWLESRTAARFVLRNCSLEPVTRTRQEFRCEEQRNVNK